MSVLVLERREGQDLQFAMPDGTSVRIRVNEIRGSRVTFAIFCEEEVKVLRGELVDRPPGAIPPHVRHDARRNVIRFPRRR